ncbi:hypothetical protein HW555_000836 [Spodoptera exigua]|uniref:Uncharacterized protein n=1 Tax=Spodoptera exigua TaxID=7107 RepID=A0A835LBW5_SPOEX|nr:hypothetical protein HW555_000836 [Spodoptera exigua]
MTTLCLTKINETKCQRRCPTETPWQRGQTTFIGYVSSRPRRSVQYPPQSQQWLDGPDIRLHYGQTQSPLVQQLIQNLRTLAIAVP